MPPSRRSHVDVVAPSSLPYAPWACSCQLASPSGKPTTTVEPGSCMLTMSNLPRGTKVWSVMAGLNVPFQSGIYMTPDLQLALGWELPFLRAPGGHSVVCTCRILTRSDPAWALQEPKAGQGVCQGHATIDWPGRLGVATGGAGEAGEAGTSAVRRPSSHVATPEPWLSAASGCCGVLRASASGDEARSTGTSAPMSALPWRHAHAHQHNWPNRPICSRQIELRSGPPSLQYSQAHLTQTAMPVVSPFQRLPLCLATTLWRWRWRWTSLRVYRTE